MAISKPGLALRIFICQSCRHRLSHQTHRAFSTTLTHNADSTSPSSKDEMEAGLTNLIKNSQHFRTRQPSDRSQPSRNPFIDILDGDGDASSFMTAAMSENLDSSPERLKPHRLHVYAHKHNTHITLVQPPRSAAETVGRRIAGAKVTKGEERKTVDTMLSLSCGNIGFRKAARSTYDAAFQLSAFVLKQMEEKGMWRDINKLEVVLRGFGAGREAVTKALLGSEGRHARTRMSAVVDATRLKQGGPRSRKPRRLG